MLQISGVPPAGLPRLEPLQTVRAGVLEVAYYYQAGPADGPPMLLHGFPYDIQTRAVDSQRGQSVNQGSRG